VGDVVRGAGRDQMARRQCDQRQRKPKHRAHNRCHSICSPGDGDLRGTDFRPRALDRPGDRPRGTSPASARRWRQSPADLVRRTNRGQGLRELREERLGSYAAAVKCRVLQLQGEIRIRPLASAAITAHDIAVTHTFQRVDQYRVSTCVIDSGKLFVKCGA
jgi:hypothetical protein